MLTSEIRINGALLGHLYLVNLQQNEGENALYSVEYYKTGKGTFKTVVLHNPDHGPEKLVEKALQGIWKLKDYQETLR